MTLTKIFIFVCLVTFSSFAQRREGSIWVFGNRGGLNFNSIPIQPYSNPLLASSAFWSSAADSNGNLLFTSDGHNVFNRNSELLSSTPISFTSSIFCLWLKQPQSNDNYYTFNTRNYGDTILSQYNKLNIRANDNRGALIEHIKIYSKDLCASMCVIKHLNNKDYWLFQHESGTDRFIGRLINETGITDSSSISSGGPVEPRRLVFPAGVIYPSLLDHGYLFSSYDSEYIFSVVCKYPNDRLSVRPIKSYLSKLKVNRANGKVNHVWTDSLDNYIFSISMSPNKRFIYLTSGPNNNIKIHQVENNDTIRNYNNIFSPTFVAQFAPLQIAIDGKIYMGTADGRNLSVINCPNEPYPNCNFTQFSQPFSTLPNPTSGRGFPTLNQTLFENVNSFQVTADRRVICLGDSVKLAAYGASLDRFRWQGPAGLNSDSSGFPVFKPTSSGIFTWQVTGTSTCTTATNSISIRVLDPIADGILGNDRNICIGSSTRIGLNNPDPSWRFLWNNGSTEPSIAVRDTGFYWVDISNGPCTKRDSIYITYGGDQISGIIRGPNIVCPSSEGTVFRFVPNDSGVSIDSLNFQWSVVGGTIVSSGADSVIIRWPSGRSDTAKIQVVATSRLGCVGDTVSLNIRINPRLEPLIPQGPNSLCSNAAIGNYSAPRTIGSTYNWNIVGGTILSGQGSNRVAVNWNSVGPWNLSYQERLTTSDTVCEGSSPVLNITVNPSPREDLRVTGNSTFCGVATTQISLLGEGSSTYRWEVGELIIQGDSNRSSINLRAPRTGVYTIRVQETNSFGCSGPVYRDTLRFNPVPVAIAGENISFCTNGSGVLGATNNPDLTYRWEPSLGLDNANISQPRVSLNQAGEYVYRLIVQNSFGCLGSSEVRVNVFALPSKPTVSGNPSACEGDTVVLRVNNPQTGNTYRWLTNTGAISGNVIRVNTSQQVVLEARNTSGCSTLGDTLNIIIYPLPPRPAISLQTDSLLCEGEPFQLSGPPAAGYRWSNGANTQSQSLTGTQQISLRTLSMEGCLSPPSNPVNLRYLDVPLPSLAHNNPLLCPEKLSGTYSVRGGNGSTYQFSVVGGTITSSNDTSVNISFEQGNITRSLTVIETTERGCLSGPITLSFQVDELLENPNSPCQLSDFPPIIPNIITPNADGFNDRFEVKNLRYYPNAELVIFNRFGKQLFQLQPYDNSFSAASLPAGTYYYLFHSGRGQTFKGWVEVVR